VGFPNLILKFEKTKKVQNYLGDGGEGGFKMNRFK
jgi:hypothetical protein